MPETLQEDAMSIHPALKPGKLLLAAALLLTCCLPLACSDVEMEKALQDAEQELAQCRKEKQQLREEVRQLRAEASRRSGQNQAEKAATKEVDQKSLKEKDQRIRQLEYTLNRAYIDMKTALLEREQCQKRYKTVRQRNKELEQRLEQTAGGY